MAEKITVFAKINAPVEKVWTFYNSPEHITKWNNADEDWHTPHAEVDLRAGGTFLSRMEAKDGSAGFDFTGTYDEVIENELIRQTLGDGRVVEIKFSPIDESTDLEITFDAENENSIEMQREGWQGILNNFKEYTEAN